MSILLSLKLDYNYSCPCCRIMFAKQTHHAPKGALHGTSVLHHCTKCTAHPLWLRSGSIILQELFSIKLDHNDSCTCCNIMFAEQTHHALTSALHSTTVLHHCPFSSLKYNMVDILFIAPLVDDKAVANAKDGFSAKFCTHFGTESFGGNFATF